MSFRGGTHQVLKMTEKGAGCKRNNVQNEFSSPWDKSDVVFVVEGRQLHCNKAVLSMVSPVFHAMFEDDFKEKTAREVPLPEKKYDDMVEFFRCIHPHVSEEVTEDRLEVLLTLADEYQCQTLTRKCRAFLETRLERHELQRQARMENDVTAEAVLRWVRLAEQFLQDQDLLERLVVEVAARMEFDKLESADDFVKLGPASLRLLFQHYMRKMNEKIASLQCTLLPQQLVYMRR